MENIHYLPDQKHVKEALVDPKAHWDNLEDSKARKLEIETRYQGQSQALQANIKHKMLEIATKVDIAFTTDFG